VVGVAAPLLNTYFGRIVVVVVVVVVVVDYFRIGPDRPIY
jgi:hypothetical protein